MLQQVTVRVELGPYVLRGREVGAVEILQGIGSHAECVVAFTRDPLATASPVAALRLAELADAQLRVVFVVDGATQHLAFAGRVREAEIDHQPTGAGHVTVTALSNSYVLSEHVDRRYLPEANVSTAATALGVKMLGGVPAGTSRDFVQAGVSAWAFLSQLAANEGLQLRARWPRTGDGAADAPAEIGKGFAPDVTHALTWGRELQRLATALAPVNAGVTGWFYEAASKHDHQSTGVRADVSWLGGARPVVGAAVAAATADADGGDPGHVELGRAGGMRARTHAEYRDRLELASARRMGGAVWATGGSVEPALRAGDRVQIKEAPDLLNAMTGGGAGALTDPSLAERTGTFGLVTVRHRWTGTLYENDFEATPWADYHPEPASVTDVAPRTAGRSAVAAPPGTSGSATSLTLGVVTDVDDPEHLGRVRVRHMWMTQAEQTTWVRVAGLGGGNGRGLGVLPSKGDEVVLGALDGDPEHLVVIGGLWNGVDKAEHGPGRQHWVTKAGHTVALVDGGKDTHDDRVELYTPEGTCWVQLTAKGPAGRPLVTVYSAGDLSLEAPHGTLRIEAKKMLTYVSGNARRRVLGEVVEKIGDKFTMTTGHLLAMSAGAGLQLSAHGSAAVTSSSMLTLLAPLIRENPPGASAPAVTTAIPEPDPSAYKKPAAPAPGPGVSTHDPKTPTKQDQAPGAPTTPGGSTGGAGGGATNGVSAVPHAAAFVAPGAAASAGVVSAGGEAARTAAAAVGALPCTAAEKVQGLAERKQAVTDARAQLATMPAGPERDALLTATDRYADDTRALGRAGLAQHVYKANDENPPELPPGYRQVRGTEDLAKYGLTPEDLAPRKSQFRAALYIDESTGQSTPVLAFKGTSSGEDWKHNGLQAIGLKSDYYERAIDVGRKLSRFTDNRFETVGHSLGGGLASAVSGVYDVRGDTYNAAGVNESTLDRHNATRVGKSGLINAYQIRGEVLTGLQNRKVQAAILTGLPGVFGPAGWAVGAGVLAGREILGERIFPSALGNARALAAADSAKYQAWYQAFNPLRAVDRHLMGTVLRSFKQEMDTDAGFLGRLDPRC